MVITSAQSTNHGGLQRKPETKFGMMIKERNKLCVFFLLFRLSPDNNFGHCTEIGGEMRGKLKMLTKLLLSIQHLQASMQGRELS